MICLGNGWCFLICFYLNLGGESHILLWGKVSDYLLAQLFPTEKIFTGEKAGYYLSISLRRLQPVALGIRGGLIWCSLFLHLACLVGGSLAAQGAPGSQWPCVHTFFIVGISSASGYGCLEHLVPLRCILCLGTVQCVCKGGWVWKRAFFHKYFLSLTTVTCSWYRR